MKNLPLRGGMNLINMGAYKKQDDGFSSWPVHTIM